MNEIVDKIFIRFLFAAFICCLLFLYKYAHFILYPSLKRQLFKKKFYPAENAADTLHLFARLIGVGIFLSGLTINESESLLLTGVNFLLWGTLGFGFYLLALYTMDSIIFYKVTYEDEILKRKNMAYAIIAFTHALCLAFLLRKVLLIASSNMEKTVILWLTSLVLLGALIKLHRFISRFPFQTYLVHENMGLAFSYSGLLLGITTVILTALDQEIARIEFFCAHIVAQILLSTLLFPFFRWGIGAVFRLVPAEENHNMHSKGYDLAMGLYEGGLFVVTCLCISLAVGHIEFGSIYPLF